MRGQESCRCCGKGSLSSILKGKIKELEDMIGAEVTITSGCRCVSKNMKCGGSSKSQHLIFSDDDESSAVDIIVDDLLLSSVAIAASEIFDGVGYYPDSHVHVDTRGHRARWIGWNGQFYKWSF